MESVAIVKAKLDIINKMFAQSVSGYLVQGTLHLKPNCESLEEYRKHYDPNLMLTKVIFSRENLDAESKLHSSIKNCIYCGNIKTKRFVHAHMLATYTKALVRVANWTGKKDADFYKEVRSAAYYAQETVVHSWTVLGVKKTTAQNWAGVERREMAEILLARLRSNFGDITTCTNAGRAYVFMQKYYFNRVAASLQSTATLEAKIVASTANQEYVLVLFDLDVLLKYELPVYGLLPTFAHNDVKAVEENLCAFLNDEMTGIDALKTALSI